VSSNIPSVDLTAARGWIHQSGEAVTASLAVAKNELQGRFEQLTESKISAVQADQRPPVATPSPTETFERSAQALATKLDQLHASSEDSTREIRAELELLKASVERSQAELTSKLSQVIERVERIEQPEARQPAAAATPPVAQVAAAVPTPPPPPRPTPEADAKLISPLPAEARREPIVIKQWTVREVLNGMALLEGPRGLVGVSPGQTLPGIGRVESIVRQGGRWVVATSNGVITGRVGPQ
jgi:peptidoglycan hydrolase-like protein with peptidoglycan-binding domain